MEMEPWEVWIRSTELHAFVHRYEAWLWPTLQTLHIFGFTLLFGTVVFFDLRALGFAKGVPLGAIHRLIPWGVAGYIGNILIGIIFFSGHPDQYYYNNAFRLKLLFMLVAGVNLLAFYGSSAFGEAKALPAGAAAPLRVKILAGTSLCAWVAVLVCARMITFNRPPFFH
jgi:hypothetical protein